MINKQSAVLPKIPPRILFLEISEILRTALFSPFRAHVPTYLHTFHN